MWSTLRRLPRAGPDLGGSASELLQSTSQHLILITGAVYLVWHLVSTIVWAETLGMRVWLITPVVLSTGLLSLRLLPRQVPAAQAVWQAGLGAAITLAIVIFRQPVVGFFYALLPLTAVITVGWQAGLLVEGVVIALVWLLCRSQAPWALPATHGWAIVVGGAYTWLVGWAATRSLLTVTQWSLFSFQQARRKVEEASDQRLELKQIQQDLIHANRELAKLSDRLQAMHQVAEEARRAKEEFVANVSHELRTPLNMIIGFSEMIPKLSQVYGTKLSPALLSDIAAIRRNSQHLARLVDDVLDLSQVEAGRMALSKEWASLKEIIDEAVQVVQALFQSKGLYLEVEVAAGLPRLFCDSTRIRQVVINLLSNAGRFTEQGGVRVRARRKEDGVVVGVTDTGPGIAPEDQKRLFEPFQQLDGSIRRQHGGSGLGLSISKRFVEMHEGEMWLESSVGGGTTFYFSLPLKTLSAVSAATGGARRWFSPYLQYEARTRRSKAPVPRLSPRFVIVEEGDTLLRMFNRYADEVEVVAVRDMQGALVELSRSPAQALIINAPAFLETPSPIGKLANLPYGTPAVTCWVPGEDQAAKRLGVVRYLLKPISRETLLATLEDLGENVRTVLLVDDEPEALRLLARMLASAERRYRVLQATNGQRALTLLRERRPDVMLLDLIMPGMDGFQVLQKKGQHPSVRETPVVVISSRDPSGEPVVSETLSVSRGGGLSVRDLLACIEAVSQVLAPVAQPDDQGQRGEPPA